jgi:hypothetical protein
MTNTLGAPAGDRSGWIGGKDAAGSYASWVFRPPYGRSGMGRLSRWIWPDRFAIGILL